MVDFVLNKVLTATKEGMHNPVDGLANLMTNK